MQGPWRWLAIAAIAFNPLWAMAAEQPPTTLNANLKNYTQAIAEQRKFESMLRGAARRGSEDPLLYQADQARRTLLNNPNDRKANEMLCDAQFRTGFLAAAAKKCREVLKIDPESATAKTVIANLLWRQENQPKAAKNLLAEVLVAQPNFTQARLLLAEISNSEGDNAAATKAIQAAVGSDANAPTLVALAKMQIDAGKNNAAQATLLQALQSDPQHAEALGLLAQLFGDKGDYARGLEFAQKSASIDAQSAIAQYRLGMQFAGLQRFPEAMASYNRAQQLDKNFAPAFRAGGLLTLQHGSPIDALSQLQIAQRLNPDDAEITTALQSAYQKMGQTRTPASTTPNALPIADKNLERALALENQQDFAQANTIYEQYTIDNPASPIGYYHLSRMFRALGNKSQAYRFADLALARQTDFAPALALRSRFNCWDGNGVAAHRDFAAAQQAGYADQQQEQARLMQTTCPLASDNF